MEPSASWFLLQAIAAGGAFVAGSRIGRGPHPRIWLWGTLGIVVLIYWGWLHHHPAIAVQAIPLRILYYIEGTAGVPAFMLLMGIAFGHSHSWRERRVAVLAVILGTIYFLHGGRWMLQTTPTAAFADTQRGGVVRQTQDYSCVPASCATVLNHLGIEATEAEMAKLTLTRPGTGATLIRAMDALRQRLKGTSIAVKMLEPTSEQLAGLAMPVMTPLQLEVGRQHMIAILRINDAGVWLADPLGGIQHMSRKSFERAYTRRVIVFER